jgi:uncharacterized membrane protein YbhN (UPF0104 family)
MLPTLKKFINPLIKISIFFGLGIILYKQVFTNTSLGEAFAYLRSDIKGRSPLLILVVLLMFCNWALETTKWRLLVNRLDNISFFRALQGILFGVAFSLFTPNRLGEYGGRVMVLKHHRIAAIVSTLVGSYSQIVVNTIFGTSAFLLYLVFFREIAVYWMVAYSIFLFLGAGFLLISYFNIDIVSVLFNRYSIFKKLAQYVDVVKVYSASDLRALLFISGCRYAVYCLQFYALLKFFKSGVPFEFALVLVPSVFFIQSVLPTLAIADVSIRGEISLQVISGFATGGALNILAASVLLWFINLIIPAVMGGIAALSFQFVQDDDD